MEELPGGTVTFLFTDGEGGTRPLHALGDRQPGILREHHGLLRAAVQARGGQEAEARGDASVFVFDRAVDAIAAAAEAQRVLAEAREPAGLSLRMALHTGDPMADAGGDVGLDLNRAAHLCAAAHAGQVLVSAATGGQVQNGLPPGVSLKDLGEHRLKDTPGPQRIFQLVVLGLPADFPPLDSLDLRPNNLPAQPTALIGRQAELAAARDDLRDGVRLLTLTGPGGTGKTRMALAVAAGLVDVFDQGVFFVDLAAVGEPSLVLSAIAQAAQVREVGDGPLLERLQHALRDQRSLLLLDNFEHLLTAAPDVAALLDACPALKVLATSREALRVRWEHEVRVPPLPLPDLRHLPELEPLRQVPAVALFVERARAVQPSFELTAENASTVAAICTSLDGLPLAIELAAARTKLLPPQALLERLSERLKLLAGGGRDAPERHQTLRNTIDWSYDLLAPEDRTLFAQLAVFAGGCTLGAAEAVCGDVLEALSSLVDRSLLWPAEGEEGQPRFSMPETLREYGLERLADSGEAEAVRRRHAEHYLGLAEAAEAELVGPLQIAWLERLEWEHDNLRTALRWAMEQGEAVIGMRLAAALWRFWSTRGHLTEGLHWIEGFISKGDEAPPPLLAKALNGAANLAAARGDLEHAVALYGQSVAMLREQGDELGLAAELLSLGNLAYRRGELAGAQSLCTESLELFRGLGDDHGIALALNSLANVAEQSAGATAAGALRTESLQRLRAMQDKRGLTLPLNYPARAPGRREGDPMARALYEESLGRFRRRGDKRGLAMQLHNLALVLHSQGDHSGAAALLEEGVALRRELGDRAGAAHALKDLAAVARSQGDVARAAGFLGESLSLFAELNVGWGVAACLEIAAGLAAAQRQFERAARLLGAAEVLREDVGVPLSAAERVQYDQDVASIRSRFGDTPFKAAWAAGRGLPPEEASAEALATAQEAAVSAGSKQPAVNAQLALLTQREREVAALVARGLTNRQVAEELVISQGTAGIHVEHILNKLDFNSRAQVAAWAAQNGLLTPEAE